MKTFLLSAAVIGGLFFQSAASAQDAKATTPVPVVAPTWAPLNIPAMTKDLALDEKAVAGVTSINEKYNKDYAILGGKGTVDQVTALLKHRDADLQTVLTAEQFKKWLTVRDAEAAAVAPQPKAAKKAAKK